MGALNNNMLLILNIIVSLTAVARCERHLILSGRESAACSIASRHNNYIDSNLKWLSHCKV